MGEYYQVNSIAKKESFKVFVDQLFEKRKFITFTYAFGDSRTRAQQGAMELYFKNAAEELNDAGVYQEINSKFFKKTLTIPWTKYSYKEFWRSVQMAMFGIKSTKDLPAGDVSKVYDVINKAMIERAGIHIPFPQKENHEHKKRSV
tara:strand:+ start:10427 stop:10864 length:438 start_codon:yes stop_codon:yes gene_type:complete